MATKTYNISITVLNMLIKEFKKEGLTDAEIIDGLEFSKKIINRVPLLTKEAKDAIKMAFADTISKNIKNEG